MKVVVTGGAGFIGANLCHALIDSEIADQVLVIDDLSTGREENLASMEGIELTVGSILDVSLLDHAFEGADAVVHLAARPSVPRSIADPMASHEANATGTLSVLEAARRGGSPQVIVASSSSVYGNNPVLPKNEEMTPMPVSPYAVSKLATECYALAHGASFGLPVLAFRFFNVFGPLQAADHAYAAVIPTFIDAALRGDPLPVHGDGGQTRDFTYVGSLAAVLAESVQRKVTSTRPVNLAFGSRVSLLDLISVLEEILGRPLARQHAASRIGDIRDTQADQTRLRSLFPEIEPVALRPGLEATVEWFRTVS